jgi:hypothetical protein
VSGKYTVAGRVEYRYVNPDALDNINQWATGISGLYKFTPKFSGMLEAEYVDYDTGRGGDNSTFITAQANYHTDGTFSLYYKTDTSGDEDNIYGVKYGVQF